jgi:hypothetical protein
MRPSVLMSHGLIWQGRRVLPSSSLTSIIQAVVCSYSERTGDGMEGEAHLLGSTIALGAKSFGGPGVRISCRAAGKVVGQ